MNTEQLFNALFDSEEQAAAYVAQVDVVLNALSSAQPTHSELLAIDHKISPVVRPTPVLMPDSAVEYDDIRKLELALLKSSPDATKSLHTARLVEAYKIGLVRYSESSMYCSDAVDINESPFPWSDFRATAGIDNHDWYPFVVESLYEAGYEVLGSGYFSLVVSPYDTPEIVIKMGLKKEDCGAAYAAFCRNLWINCEAGAKGYDPEVIKHFPRVLHMERVEPFYVVVMPRYEALDKYSENIQDALEIQHRRYRYIIRDLLDNPLSYNQATLSGRTVNFKYTTNDLLCLKAAFDNNELVERQYNTIMRAYNDQVDLLIPSTLQHALQMVHSFFKGVATFDLHDENIMVASVNGSDKYAVLTDPVSYAAYENY